MVPPLELCVRHMHYAVEAPTFNRREHRCFLYSKECYANHTFAATSMACVHTVYTRLSKSLLSIYTSG